MNQANAFGPTSIEGSLFSTVVADSTTNIAQVSVGTSLRSRVRRPHVCCFLARTAAINVPDRFNHSACVLR